MNKKDNFALVPRPPGALEKAQPGAKRILAGIVADALALVKKEPFAAAAAKFRIDDYEWCEPDYRQILLWAGALRMEPKTVVELLLNEEHLLVEDNGQRLLIPFWDGPAFANGRLLLIVWDYRTLPLWNFEWVDDLQITHLKFRAPSNEHPVVDLGRLPLRHLECLDCYNINLKQPALSGLCALKSLNCARNLLPALDLSGVAGLEVLDCSENALAELDLTHTPGLLWLTCSLNSIPRLDLSAVPDLQMLICSDNCIETLDLSRALSLVSLNCANNQLRDLNLGAVSQLSSLDCSDNKLTTLELRHTPQLQELDCAWNNLHSLDLSGVPELEKLRCEGNPIFELDISPLEHLVELECGPQTRRLLQREDQDF